MHVCSFSLLSQINHIKQLRQEIDALPENAWLPHVNKQDYQGDWDLMPLRCAAEHQVAHPILQAFAIQTDSPWHDLARLDTCPSIVTLLDSLACPAKSVRLMRLQPNSKIKPHRDMGLSIEQGEARLHLSLQTNDQLRFMVNNQIVAMTSGELWYMNADQIHGVENYGTEARINLVVDCEANAWLKESIDTAKIRA